MSYTLENYLNILKQLSPLKHKQTGFTVLDLFAGCGGLALGFEAAGFETIGYECNEDAVSTYNKNLSGKCFKEFLTTDITFPVTEIVIGGPPCQPFSVSGLQSGLSDSRDGFPVFIKAVEVIKPSLWIFENVRGMLYRNKNYLHEIIKTLEKLDYYVDVKLIKAVDFQVPQNRERLFVVGHKGGYKFPDPFNDKFTAGDAVKDIAFINRSDDVFLSKSQDEYIKKYEIKSNCLNPRDLHMNKPARTLTCRNLAGGTGDMHRIAMPDGRRKRLNVREAARLQSFPDWFQFSGKKNSQFYQIGNAVPPLLSFHIANSVKSFLLGETMKYNPNHQLSLW